MTGLEPEDQMRRALDKATDEAPRICTDGLSKDDIIKKLVREKKRHARFAALISKRSNARFIVCLADGNFSLMVDHFLQHIGAVPVWDVDGNVSKRPEPDPGTIVSTYGRTEAQIREGATKLFDSGVVTVVLDGPGTRIWLERGMFEFGLKQHLVMERLFQRARDAENKLEEIGDFILRGPVGGGLRGAHEALTQVLEMVAGDPSFCGWRERLRAIRITNLSGETSITESQGREIAETVETMSQDEVIAQVCAHFAGIGDTTL